MSSHDAILRRRRESFGGLRGCYREMALRRNAGCLDEKDHTNDDGAEDVAIMATDTGKEVKCGEATDVQVTQDAAIGDRMDTYKRTMRDVDSIDGQLCDRFHGPFCGVSDWLQWMHGRWKAGMVNMALIGQKEWWNCKVADKQVVVEGKWGAVLRLPAAYFMADDVGRGMMMATYIWRPPWWGSFRQRTETTGGFFFGFGIGGMLIGGL